MRKPNKYNTKSGTILQGNTERYFTFDEIDEDTNLDFALTNPMSDFTNVIVAELDIPIFVNDIVIINGHQSTVESYKRKPVRNKRRNATVYEYTLVLK